MERQRPAFNANPDTGKLGYRNPEFDYMPDERPVLVYPYQFWKDEDERQRYELAAKHCPVSAYGNLTLDQYLSAIVEVATGLKPSAAVKVMPHAGRLEEP